MWLYGNSGDVRLGGGGNSVSTPNMSDSVTLQANPSDEGINHLNEPWSATANWYLTHGYSVGGDQANVTSFSIAGDTSLSTFTDNAYSEITTNSNLLRLEFTIGGNPGDVIHWKYRAILHEAGGLADATVRVDKNGAFGWGAAGIWASTPGGGSDFGDLYLTPGQYRVEGTSYARVTSTDPASSGYLFNLWLDGTDEPAFVPEPSTAMLFLCGALALVRRSRITRNTRNA